MPQHFSYKDAAASSKQFSDYIHYNPNTSISLKEKEAAPLAHL